MILAQLSADSGLALRSVILGILGTVVVIVLAARALAAFIDDRWGKLVGLVLGAAVVMGICMFPDEAQRVLTALWSAMVSGSG